MEAMETSAEDTQRPSGRRPWTKRSCAWLTEDAARAIARQVVGSRAGDATLITPAQGLSGWTYLLKFPEGDGLVIKLQPSPWHQPRDRSFWPRHTQALFGPRPNGGVETVLALTGRLTSIGTLRIPQVYLADDSLELVASPYVVSEYLPGIPYDWSGHVLSGRAVEQLGEHLARVHAATAGAPAFGIFVSKGEYSADAWWLHFRRTFRTLVHELSRRAAIPKAVEPQLNRALERAVAAGSPGSMSLVCIDQRPAHYLDRGDGSIGGMIEVEAHLWGPREYELAAVQCWISDREAFRTAYERHYPWPAVMEEVQPAYGLFSFMERTIRCHTSPSSPTGAAALEQRLRELCTSEV